MKEVKLCKDIYLRELIAKLDPNDYSTVEIEHRDSTNGWSVYAFEIDYDNLLKLIENLVVVAQILHKSRR